MRIIETKVYKFDELTEEAKQKAIENLYDINVDYEWWDLTYDDAANIGLKITGFDLDRASYVEGEFMDTALETAQAIIKEHGEQCETFKTAQDYMIEYNRLLAEQCQEVADDLYHRQIEPEIVFDLEYDDYINTGDIDAEFLKSLCEDYRIILQKEYEYLTSEAAIIETIQANEYEFTEDGELV